MKVLGLCVGMLRTNCYIAYMEGRADCVVVDPGAEPKKIEAKMAELGLSPKAILLTHGHFDHILAVEPLRERFPGLEVYALDEEEPLFSDSGANLSDMMRSPVTLSGLHFLGDREEIGLCGMKFLVIATPGHTAGSCCFYVPEEKVLFSGDTLFCESMGRTDFPGGDEMAILESISQTLMELPDEVKVYPGHESATDIGHERRYNPAVYLYRRFR